MSLFSVRYPRDRVVDATNLCSNPSFETNLDFWDGSYYGPGTPGTFTRMQAAYAKRGSWFAKKTWGATSSNVTGAGFALNALNTSPGWTWETEAYLACPNDGISVWATAQWLDAGGSQISVSFGQVVTGLVNAWAQVRGSFTAPAGAATVRFGFALTGGGRFSGDELWIDMVTVYSGPFVGYFDGSGGDGNPDYQYSWDGAAHGSFSRRTIDNPGTRILPDMVLGYDSARTSRNFVHEFLSGNVGATQNPAGLRTGTLSMFFKDPAQAAAAERVHAGKGFFQFGDDDNPADAMNFVLNGPLRSYQDETRKHRVLDIPYQEITV